MDHAPTHPTITTAAAVAAFEADGARIFSLAAGTLDHLVPSCPGWTVADLVGHLGAVYGWMATTIGECPTERPSHRFVVAETDDVVGWCREGHAAVAALLARTDPSTPCWNWAGTGEAGFYHRRMAAETLVHRLDLEHALEAPTPVDGDLAADAVDEAIAVGFQHSLNPKREYRYPAGSLHLHRTDGAGEWLLAAAGGGGLEVRRVHEKGDVAVRGTARELLWWIWGRPDAEVEIFGDAELADAWTHVTP